MYIQYTHIVLSSLNKRKNQDNVKDKNNLLNKCLIKYLLFHSVARIPFVINDLHISIIASILLRKFCKRVWN